MNVEIGTVAAQFPFWEYLFRRYCVFAVYESCPGKSMTHTGNRIPTCKEVVPNLYIVGGIHFMLYSS
jgi:hypothetical protein